jgi:oxygen-independent coproporphyrinogen-3 oxidase
MLEIQRLINESPYIAYSYSYPHKTAYRNLEKTISLRNIWQTEKRNSLFLYIHVPFCEMRCGFCNLFTIANPKENFEDRYLITLESQASQTAKALVPSEFTRFAIGGGTPTFLSIEKLEKLLNIANKYFNIDISNVPTSIETSPFTATKEKLELLNNFGVSRISIGVQSFIEKEVNAVGRSQKTNTVLLALEAIRSFNFPILNIDLIYGLPGQTLESWKESLNIALSFLPEELYLYPLYVRPLTGLGKQNKTWDDERINFYRVGRDILLEKGYIQHSMRMFQLPNKNTQNPLAYCCQTDGMVGIGTGARSYTSKLHYSTEYAVSSKGVKDILDDYVIKNSEDFSYVNYGVFLDTTEQKNRFIIQSLLQVEGLNLEFYQNIFASKALEDIPKLNHLLESNLAEIKNDRFYLNSLGLEKSDFIGYWLYSDKVITLINQYTLR